MAVFGKIWYKFYFKYRVWCIFLTDVWWHNTAAHCQFAQQQKNTKSSKLKNAVKKEMITQKYVWTIKRPISFVTRWGYLQVNSFSKMGSNVIFWFLKSSKIWNWHFKFQFTIHKKYVLNCRVHMYSSFHWKCSWW